MLTLLALIAFASNSLLCRVALRDTSIDAASFTTIRLISGAIVLALIVLVRQRSLKQLQHGSWASAAALFVYAAAFSFSYRSLSAGTGALLLFGAVQISMISVGLMSGERYRKWQLIGFVIASVGLVGMLLPGLHAPPLFDAMLMILAGTAWGIFSLRGKRSGDPVLAITGNFLRTIPFIAVMSVAMWSHFSLDTNGVLIAFASGAIASGLGYVVWYTALKKLTATTAANVQLATPVLTALGAIVVLGEDPTVRLLIFGTIVLAGIMLSMPNAKRQMPNSN